MTVTSDLLPRPFAWMPILAGEVEVISIITKERPRANYIPEGTSQVFHVDAFEMAKYPLTNAQFAVFIAAGGYRQRRWWTDEGWQFKEQREWTAPLFWRDARWNKPDYPVVGVSWYEAVAYCRWLSAITREKITLPSEQQWQHAAQGD